MPGASKVPPLRWLNLINSLGYTCITLIFIGSRIPRELEEAGFREYFDAETVCLVEWPEKAGGLLPAADLTSELATAGTGRQVEIDSRDGGRQALFREAHTGVSRRPAAAVGAPLRSSRSPVRSRLCSCWSLRRPGAGGYTDLLRARVACADYTRVTLETAAPVQHTLLTLKDPDRLVLDLQGVDITAALTGLSDKIGANDPYVKGVRIGRFKPGRRAPRVRSEERGEAAGLRARAGRRLRAPAGARPLSPRSARSAARIPGQAPGAARGNRRAPEPPAAVAKPQPAPFQSRTPRQPRDPVRPTPRRLIIVAIDAGHGGEDPGARGRAARTRRT